MVPAGTLGGQNGDERLRKVVSSNLSRRTGYLPILAAAREAVALLTDRI